MTKGLVVLGSVLVIALAYRLYTPPRIGKTVKTRIGKVQGVISKSRDGRDYYEWLGIPFAKPPVGDLRFAVITIKY